VGGWKQFAIAFERGKSGDDVTQTIFRHALMTAVFFFFFSRNMRDVDLLPMPDAIWPTAVEVFYFLHSTSQKKKTYKK
jgi:hypothetical protein